MNSVASRGEKGWQLNRLNCSALIWQASSPQIPCVMLMAALNSRLVFHSRWKDGAPDAAAVAVYTHTDDGYASSELSGDVWQRTPAVTDEMDSGGND